MEATSYGDGRRSLDAYPSVSQLSEFDRLRRILAKAKNDYGLEVTIDGQIEGIDYIHTPQREYPRLSAWQIERRIETLVREGRIHPQVLKGFDRFSAVQDSVAENLATKIAKSEQRPLKDKTIGAVNALLVLGAVGGFAATLSYLLSEYLQ